MKRWIKQIAGRIDELSIRERGLVLLAVVAVLFMFWDTFMMQPLYQQQDAIEHEIAEKQESINRLAQALQEVAVRQDSNPNRRLQQERSELERQIADLDERLSEEAANIISPSRMAVLLQDVLRRQQTLELREIRSLPPEAIFAATTDAEMALQGNVFRHGLVMEVEGSYLALLAYLREIESLPYTFIWDRLEIETLQYPRNRITIRVFTLSLSEELIGA